jgi:hypothetical protein
MIASRWAIVSAIRVSHFGSPAAAPSPAAAVGQDDVGRERDQFGRVPADAIVVDAPARVDLQVAAFVPTELAQPSGVPRGELWHLDRYPPYPVRLLRPRIERPRRRRAAEQRDECAPSNVTCHAPSVRGCVKGRIPRQERAVPNSARARLSQCPLRSDRFRNAARRLLHGVFLSIDHSDQPVALPGEHALRSRPESQARHRPSRRPWRRSPRRPRRLPAARRRERGR